MSNKGSFNVNFNEGADPPHPTVGSKLRVWGSAVEPRGWVLGLEIA